MALLMNRNSYVGREYLSRLIGHNIEVITTGNFQEINLAEETRCGGLWKPISEDELRLNFKFHDFESLDDPRLLKHLEAEKYVMAIQGGTGILKAHLINVFALGIINAHPGRLPMYRGCSAPEWQIYEGVDVYCTLHLIDQGVDTGPIIQEKKLKSNQSSYFEFRASIYKEIATIISDFIIQIKKDPKPLTSVQPQVLETGRYLKYIGEDKIKDMISEWPIVNSEASR